MIFNFILKSTFSADRSRLRGEGILRGFGKSGSFFAPRGRAVIFLLAAVGLALGLWLWLRPTISEPLVEVPRSEVALHNGLLALKTTPDQPFTGVMVEKAVGGRLLTKVPVARGKVHGLSQGWHDNGQLEVEENFVDGTSHGPRKRWHANGQKKSEASIVQGVLEGEFREWHDNGQLAVVMPMKAGKGEGVCEAWFPDGKPKSRVVLKDGQPVETNYFSQISEKP
jgi:hypothetical protein